MNLWIQREDKDKIYNPQLGIIYSHRICQYSIMVPKKTDEQLLRLILEIRPITNVLVLYETLPYMTTLQQLPVDSNAKFIYIGLGPVFEMTAIRDL